MKKFFLYLLALFGMTSVCCSSFLSVLAQEARVAISRPLLRRSSFHTITQRSRRIAGSMRIESVSSSFVGGVRFLSTYIPDDVLRYDPKRASYYYYEDESFNVEESPKPYTVNDIPAHTQKYLIEEDIDSKRLVGSTFHMPKVKKKVKKP